MATATASISKADAQHPGVNQSVLQRAPIIIDVPDSMADNDDVLFTVPTPVSEIGPRTVTAMRHTGGDITSAASATFVLSDGDTLILQIDPDGNGVFVEVTHVLAGVSAGAATAAEIAASINGDTALAASTHAVAGLTSNAVTLFPAAIRGALRVIGGTAQTLLLFPGTVADWRARVYVSQSGPVIAGGTGWSWSYSAATRVLTVVNETGAAANRTTIVVEV